MQTRREMWIHSPRTNGFEPGVYEVSAWVRGRPGTIAAFGIDALGAMFGAGIQGVDDQWKKFSLTVYCKGITGPGQWPEQSQLLLAVFPPGQRGQIASPLLDIDDVSISRLSSGLADTFSDHMVLQRERPVPIRGWAKEPGQHVTVSFNGQTRSAIADQEGRWQTMLDPMKAGGPYLLKLDGRPTAFDVMVGDVWICSGQSNMEFGIDKLNGQWNHAPEEVAKANQPLIRLWQAPKQFSAKPMHGYLMHQSAYPNDYQARWNVCTPATVADGIWGGFSAVGYFFGREIQADQKVAIGLMMIANGGTQIESFISPEGLRSPAGSVGGAAHHRRGNRATEESALPETAGGRDRSVGGLLSDRRGARGFAAGFAGSECVSFCERRVQRPDVAGFSFRGTWRDLVPGGAQWK